MNYLFSPTPPKPLPHAPKPDQTSLFDKIEKAFFFTSRNVTTLLLAGVCSSLVLAWIVPVRQHWLLAPIFAYAAVNMWLLYIHLRQHAMHPQKILLIKAISDIVVTVYWINMYAWETRSSQFYFLPVLMLTAITLYNTRPYKAMMVSIALYIAVLVSGGVFVAVVGIEKIGILGIGVYYLLAIHAMWAHQTHTVLGVTVRKEMTSAEARIDELINTGKTIELAARIVKHDINNHLMSIYAPHLKNPDDPSSQEHAKTYEALVEPINERLLLLSNRGVSEIELYRLVQGVLPFRYSSVDIERNIFVKMPFLLLISFLRNICENAQEAYTRLHGSLNGFHLTARMLGNTLEIRDNAGGFDVNGISVGVSRKGEGHGIFLATFLNDTRQLGLRTGIERVADGTVIRMTFDEVRDGRTHKCSTNQYLPLEANAG